MKKSLTLLLFSGICLLSYSQKKKSKGKETTHYEQTDSLPPVVKDSKKGKDSKKDKKAPVKTEYISVGEENPVPDTATRFTGIIKYRMTSDDPAERDSMIIYFGENQIRVTMFIPGYRADQIFEQTAIARFADSMLITLDPRTKTYKTEPLSARNAGTEFMLLNRKKTMPIMSITCPEYSGEMTLMDGETFQAACLVSKQHSYIAAMDYNFLNIQPVVFGYKIVLGWRTKSAENENTYIIAYKIEKGSVESYFDLMGYRPK
ncbi:MAG: hypothetical protein FJY20_09400 [Bacteroidetes bacterium]|nr:hypothetical protein [Bacteroidota bacterium]